MRKLKPELSIKMITSGLKATMSLLQNEISLNMADRFIITSAKPINARSL